MILENTCGTLKVFSKLIPYVAVCSERGEVCPSSPAAEMGHSGFGEDIHSNVVLDALVVFSLGEQSVLTMVGLQR